MSTAFAPNRGHRVQLPRLLAHLASALVCWLTLVTPSHAVPSFARQTGEECGACHIGAFGPQLTPHGMRFKLNGYTESDGKEGHVPLSGMLVGSWTQTQKDQSEKAGPYDGTNDNSSLQEASIFLAGGLTEHLGAFVQGTYSDINRQLALDNADLRYARTVQLGGEDTVVGLSFNNNPTLGDPFNSVPAWRFPYMASELVPGAASSPIVDGGLEQQVGGITLYALWNDSVYGELGGYKSFSKSFLQRTNVIARDDSLDKIDGVAPYWRVGYFKDLHRQAWQVGVFGFDPNLTLDGTSGPTDKYRDIGIDASYQFLGTRKHVFTANTAYIHESRTLDGTFNSGNSDRRSGNVNRFDLSGSYYYDQTWGLTVGLFDISGSRDSLLYAPEADSGSRVGNPNTSGYILQADWTPWGKEDSWGAPWANLRLGLQYTGYTKFNGASHNYDGEGRNASDNNTLFGFVWAAF